MKLCIKHCFKVGCIIFSCNYKYRHLWTILFVHLKRWALVYNSFSVTMRNLIDTCPVILYFCSHVAYSEHFVIKISPQLLYWPTSVDWIFFIMVTKTSIIYNCSHIIMIQKPRLRPLLHRNSCKHSSLWPFVKGRMEKLFGGIHFDVSFFLPVF